MLSLLIVISLSRSIICADTCENESCESTPYEQEVGQILKIIQASPSTPSYGEDNELQTSKSALILWLKHHNFHDVITKFEEESTTLNELILMGKDTEYLQKYLNAINIPQSFISRITFQIKQILKNNVKNNEKNFHKKPKKANMSFKQELAQIMIPDDMIGQYQFFHDLISTTIENIAPSSRAISKSIKTVSMKRKNIDLLLPVLLKDVANDLGTSELDEKLIDIFETEARYAKIGAVTAKEEYSRVSLSYRFNEDTYFIVGAVGFRENEDNENEVEFGVALYQERWKENWQEVFKRWITFGNTAGEILMDSEVEKFAMYRLYQKLV